MDSYHHMPQDSMVYRLYQSYHRKSKEQFAQFRQQHEEQMMPEIAVHTFNSHGVPEMLKKLQTNSGCSSEPSVAGGESLASQDPVGCCSAQTEISDRGDVFIHTVVILQVENKESAMRVNEVKMLGFGGSCTTLDPFARIKDAITRFDQHVARRQVTHVC